MIRFFDFMLSFIGIVILLPLMIVLYVIGLFDTGSPLFLQTRVGKNKKPFTLIKFRSMRKGTKSVATHLVNKNSITKYGAFLRRTKLDELPQLFNVLIGNMSMVGPRPNLYNQTELIEERDMRGVYKVLPGITGLSQILDTDMETPIKMAIEDEQMIQNMSIFNYFKYIIQTVTGKGQGDCVKN